MNTQSISFVRPSGIPLNLLPLYSSLMPWTTSMYLCEPRNTLSLSKPRIAQYTTISRYFQQAVEPILHSSVDSTWGSNGEDSIIS